MTATTLMQRNARPIRREAATHLFAVGQAVRLRGNFGTFPKTAEILPHHRHAAAEGKFPAIPHSQR